MPAPEHLRIVLDALGTGGTVEMAEGVHHLISGLTAERDALAADAARLAEVLVTECGATEPGETAYAAVARILRAQAAEIQRLNTLMEPQRATLREKIEASSLGTPEAVAARASVPVEVAQAAVARAAELVGDDEDDDLSAVTTGDLMLAREAAASVALDHDPRAETIALDDWGDDEPGPADDGITDPKMDEASASVAIDQDRTGAHTAKLAMARPAPTNDEIRDWCRAHGVAVSDRGPIGKTARAKYDAAHQGV